MNKSKTNIIKYGFITFIVILAVITYMTYKKNNSKPKETSQTVTTLNSNMIKEIRLGIAQFDTINPILTRNKNVQAISKLIFDSLITFDENYNFNYGLAKEISKKSNKEYVIKLKENILWHSGEKLIAEDVKYTIDVLKALKSSIYKDNIKMIENVQIIDEHTLNIILKNDTPFFEYNLTFPIMSKKYYEGVPFNKTNKNLAPTGTGMYRIDSTAKNVIKLIKNKNYWDVDSKNCIIENININLYSNMGEIYTAFKNGNIDLVDTSLTSVRNYIGTLGYTAATYKTKEFDYLAFNCSTTILKEAKVRKAISYAIDTNSIVQSCYGRNYSVSTFPLDFGSWVYSNIENISNKTEAKKLLIEAGWKYSNRSWSKNINGKRVKLEFTITVNSKSGMDIKVAENIQNQLRKIGINVNIKQILKNNYYNCINSKKGYEAIIVNINTSYTPNLNTYLGNGNISNYSNNGINEWLKQVYATGDSNTIKELYEKIFEKYKEEVPFIGIARKNGVIVYNTNLVGIGKPTEYNLFSKFQNWYRKNY